MRALLVCLFALATSMPAASAASATLVLTPSEAAVASGANVPLSVRLEVRDFWCPQPRELTVELTARGAGATGVPAEPTLRFMTDDASHFGEAYVVEGSTVVQVESFDAAGGTVELTATFAPDLTGCFAPDGFAPVTARATFHVGGGNGAPPPPPPAPPPPPQPENETNATGNAPPPAANESGGSENGTLPTQESVDRLPPGGGYIGDYAPTGEVESVGVPGPGALAAVAALAALAVLLGRKR